MSTFYFRQWNKVFKVGHAVVRLPLLAYDVCSHRHPLTSACEHPLISSAGHAKGSRGRYFFSRAARSTAPMRPRNTSTNANAMAMGTIIRFHMGA